MSHIAGRGAGCTASTINLKISQFRWCVVKILEELHDKQGFGGPLRRTLGPLRRKRGRVTSIGQCQRPCCNDSTSRELSSSKSLYLPAAMRGKAGNCTAARHSHAVHEYLHRFASPERVVAALRSVMCIAVGGTWSRAWSERIKKDTALLRRRLL